MRCACAERAFEPDPRPRARRGSTPGATGAGAAPHRLPGPATGIRAAPATCQPAHERHSSPARRPPGSPRSSRRPPDRTGTSGPPVTGREADSRRCSSRRVPPRPLRSLLSLQRRYCDRPSAPGASQARVPRPPRVAPATGCRRRTGVCRTARSAVPRRRRLSPCPAGRGWSRRPPGWTGTPWPRGDRSAGASAARRPTEPSVAAGARPRRARAGTTRHVIRRRGPPFPPAARPARTTRCRVRREHRDPAPPARTRRRDSSRTRSAYRRCRARSSRRPHPVPWCGGQRPPAASSCRIRPAPAAR